MFGLVLDEANPNPQKKIGALTKSYIGLRRLDNPSVATFLREAVASNTPCIITGLLDDTDSFSRASLLNMSIDETVNVNFTPDGRADAINSGEDCFTLPLEESIPAKLFLDLLEKPTEHDAVPYLSEQNDNLTSRFHANAKSFVRRALEFSTEAFGEPADALNVWMGDSRSVSSTHKDHYHNTICVLEGAKQFCIWPPSDVLFLPSRRVKVKRWKRKEGRQEQRILRDDLELSDAEQSHIEWIGKAEDEVFSPSPPYSSPHHVTVPAGSVLYLPPLYFHRVSNVGITTAVNFWFDMDFNSTNWVSFQALSIISGKTVDEDS
jgi:jumonji domain-containing protein 7